MNRFTEKFGKCDFGIQKWPIHPILVKTSNNEHDWTHINQIECCIKIKVDSLKATFQSNLHCDFIYLTDREHFHPCKTKNLQTIF